MINLRENYKIYIWSILGSVICFIVFIWIRGMLSGEEGRVRRFILQGKKAVESKNIFTCADMISLSYEDKYDNNRQTLIYIAKEVFGYYQNLFVHIENMEINLNDTKTQASVEITALVIGQNKQKNTEKILEAENGRFRVKLIKEENKWRLLELEFFESIPIMGQNIS